MTSDFSFQNEVFSQFAFYAGVVVVKMVLMSPMTGFNRITKKIFINPEDNPGGKLTVNNPDVERVRRCHLNDIENIVPFVLLGGLYVLTGPSAYAASMHFRIFAVARICHTIAYLLALPQPSRFLSYLAGMVVIVSMATSVIRAGTF